MNHDVEVQSHTPNDMTPQSSQPTGFGSNQMLEAQGSIMRNETLTIPTTNPDANIDVERVVERVVENLLSKNFQGSVEVTGYRRLPIDGMIPVQEREQDLTMVSNFGGSQYSRPPAYEE